MGGLKCRSFASLVLVCLIAGSGATASDSIISGPYTVVVGSTSDSYYVIQGTSGASYDLLQQASWTSNEAEAQALGTNLITILSNGQNTTVLGDVADNFSGSVSGLNLLNVPLWIGLNDKSHDSTQGGADDASTHAADFSWADGSTSTYRNWNPGEPNDSSPGEYYAAAPTGNMQRPLLSPTAHGMTPPIPGPVAMAGTPAVPPGIMELQSQCPNHLSCHWSP